MIGHNDWHGVEVPRMRDGPPSMSISVILPARDNQMELSRALASMACQDYPKSLLQIVVVDDGSACPLSVDDDGVRLIRSAGGGFGAGRARNVGAAHADGEALIFMDSDIVAERSYVSAQARWLETIEYAVTLSFRRFVDFVGLGADDVRTAVESGTIARLLHGRGYTAHEWIEEFVHRTGELRERRDDLFRIVVGAGLGVRRTLFEDVGGFTEFGRRGVEDTELGYKLFTAGALIVPERGAQSWHQGQRSMKALDDNSKDVVDRGRLPILTNHIPARQFRSPSASRMYTVARFAIVVDTADHNTDEVRTCVESLLLQEPADLRILVLAAGSVADELIDWFPDEPRVVIGAQFTLDDLWPMSPLRLTTSPVYFSRSSLRELWTELSNAELGALHAIVEGPRHVPTIATLRLTRAERRAERAYGKSESACVDAWVGSTYGERWVSGAAFGLCTPDDEPSNRSTGALNGGASAASPVRWTDAERELSRLRQRRVLKLANFVGRLSAIRTVKSVLGSVQRFGKSSRSRPIDG